MAPTPLASFHHAEGRGRVAAGLLWRNPDGSLTLAWRTPVMAAPAFERLPLLDAWRRYREHRERWAWMALSPQEQAALMREMESRRLRWQAHRLLAEAGP